MLKRTNSKKVTNKMGTLDLKHRGAISCGEKDEQGNYALCARVRIYSGAVSLGTIVPG